MNYYVNQFMQWAIDFRGRSTVQILLAQANRGGGEKAAKHKGAYEITAIAEANETERASSRVLSIYTNDELKTSRECKVGILKSRFGETCVEPITVFVDPVCCVLGDEVHGTDNRGTDADFDSLFDA